jgi:GT2 family glycosyltransferase
MNVHHKRLIKFFLKEFRNLSFHHLITYLNAKYSKKEVQFDLILGLNSHELFRIMEDDRANDKEYGEENWKYIGVVIPVYKMTDYLDKNLGIIKKYYPDIDVVVIDDSGHQSLVLKEDSPNITIIRNKDNLGYTKSINIGIKNLMMQNKKYIYTLNSDVLIDKSFFCKIQRKMRKNRIASVTALSNGKTDYDINLPNIAEETLILENSNKSLEIISRYFNNTSYSTPTSIGYACAYSSKALRKVGLFDENKFPAGYGEENDWSLRATSKGFKHLMALDTVVIHKKSHSFGHRSIPLKNFGLRKVHDDYPVYSRYIENMAKLNRVIQKLSILNILNLQIFTDNYLFISHGLGGGATQFENEMDDEVRISFLQSGKCGYRVHFISSHTKQNRFRIEIRVEDQTNIIEDLSFEDGLEIIRKFNFKKVYLGALSGNNNRYFLSRVALENICDWIKINNFETNLIVHDFYSICPSYTLIDYKATYCDVPEIKVCESCIIKNSFAATPIDFMSMEDWRDLFIKFFELENIKIICWTENSRNLLIKTYGSLVTNKTVIVNPKIYMNVSDNAYRTVKIASVGSLNYAKGSSLIIELANKFQNTFGKFKYEFSHFGGSEFIDNSNIHYHGRYQRYELQKLLIEKEINFLIIPSLWPETYAQVVDEVSNLGLPIICLSLGGIYDRFKDNNNFIFVDDFEQSSIELLQDKIASMLNDKISALP